MKRIVRLFHCELLGGYGRLLEMLAFRAYLHHIHNLAPWLGPRVG